jgi:hypothetical protein
VEHYRGREIELEVPNQVQIVVRFLGGSGVFFLTMPIERLTKDKKKPLK